MRKNPLLFLFNQFYLSFYRNKKAELMQKKEQKQAAVQKQEMIQKQMMNTMNKYFKPIDKSSQVSIHLS